MTGGLFRKLLLVVVAVAAVVTGQDMTWYLLNPNAETFRISNEQQLRGLALLVNNGTTNFGGRTIILDDDITLTMPHTPIGINSSNRFCGIFDGNRKTISDLSVNVDSYAGLFGYVGTDLFGRAGQIKNLTLNVIEIIGGNSTGGLAGYYASTGAIENCRVYIADSIYLTYETSVLVTNVASGGLVGTVDIRGSGFSDRAVLTISNSYVIGRISSFTSHTGGIFSGGLVGELRNVNNLIEINNSHANVSVSSISNRNANSANARAGGLVGSSDYTTINNSYATGDVYSEAAWEWSYSGGLIGHGGVTVNHSHSTANVSSNGTSGGLIGYAILGAIINDSYSTGDVSSFYESGGLIGLIDLFWVTGIMTDTTIVRSYSTGNISTSEEEGSAGGLIGEVRNSGSGHMLPITNSYATGNVSGDIAGGLVGTVPNSHSYRITNSYASGRIEGITRTGGIVGQGLMGIGFSVYFNSEGAAQGEGSGAFTAGISGVTPAELRQRATFVGWDFDGVWSIDSEINDGFPYLSTERDISGEFTDPVFLAEIYRAIGKTAPAPIYIGDVDTITALNIARGRTRDDLIIRNLNGIQYLISLKFLDVSGHDIDSLDISRNTDLERLDISGNQLTRINITHNIGLKFLDVSENRLNELDVTNNDKLEHIDVRGNQLTRIDVTHNIGLKFLDISGNNLTSKDDVIGIDLNKFQESNLVFTVSIRNIKRTDNRHGIRFAENIVSDNAEIFVNLPNNERAVETKIIVYDMTGNVVHSASTGSATGVVWDLRNTAGRFVANGTYLVIAEVKDRNGKVYQYSARLGVKRSNDLGSQR